jgi:hypothetical protein
MSNSNITEGDLNMRNYVLLVDKSGSMGEPSRGAGSPSRWDSARESALAVARECAKRDADGIDVYTFNKGFQRYPNTTPEKVSDIFRTEAPMGGTDFVPVLRDVFDNHFKGSKPTTVLVLTDGEPSDGAAGQSALAKLIVATSQKLEGDAELAVQFIQVGQDPAATSFLKKLDDNLQSAGAKFDIVDAKTMEDLETMSITDVLLAAVND